MKIVALTIVAALFMLAFSAGAADDAKMNSGNESQKNIVDTAIAAGDFKTLTEAVKAAGLLRLLAAPDLLLSLPLQMKPLPMFQKVS
jgi:uncharacterized surface protein with fasciclin (FAS1) repeats